MKFYVLDTSVVSSNSRSSAHHVIHIREPIVLVTVVGNSYSAWVISRVIYFAEDVNNMSVRFRLYGCEKIRRQRLIGECIVSFANVNLQLQSNIWVPLEPRANTAVIVSFLFLKVSNLRSFRSIYFFLHR